MKSKGRLFYQFIAFIKIFSDIKKLQVRENFLIYYRPAGLRRLKSTALEKKATFFEEKTILADTDIK